MSFNTAVSALMVCANEFDKSDTVSVVNFEKYLKIISPFAPFTADELWRNLGKENSIHTELWPKYDVKLTQEKNITIAIQVNGKVRATLYVQVGEEKNAVINKAKELPEVKKWVGNSTIKKEIYVPNKLVSFVV